MIAFGALLFLINIVTLTAAPYLESHPVLGVVAATIIYVEAVIFSAFLIALGLAERD